MKRKNRFAVLLAVLIVASMALVGCGGEKEGVRPEALKALNIGVLKGPTALGAVKIIENEGQYGSVSVIASPEDMSAKFISGQVDIAAVPTNLAAVLYQKTEGKARVLAINTLGVLYILSRDDGVKSMADLKGKTIVTSGQGSTPEYILNDLLKKNGLTPGTDVTVDFRSEHSEVASLATAGQADVVMVPEPFVTSITGKSADMRIAVDMTQAWKEANGDIPLVMGCIIAREGIGDEEIDAFLKEYKASTEFANENTEETAKIIGQADIMPEAVVKSALPRCNITFMGGNEMKDAMVRFLTALYEANPKSVGGKMPEDNFYYGAK